ncbi:MAG: hypothetical protein RL328_328 [Acidobacteriota bacterium]|jgi:hypothetical protein
MPMNGNQLSSFREPTVSVQVGSPMRRPGAPDHSSLSSASPDFFYAREKAAFSPASVCVDSGYAPTSAIGLLNSKQLAHALGVSPWILKGIKRAGAATGDSPFVGRYSTLQKIQAWLDRNPQFVASHHLRSRSP